MNLSDTKEFTMALGAHSLKYVDLELPADRGSDAIVVHIPGKNMEWINCHCLFADGKSTVSFRVYEVAKVEDKKNIPSVLILLNILNRKYHYAKFCLDMDDDTIQVEYDTTYASSARLYDNVYNALRQVAAICDDAYPRILDAAQGRD